MNSKFVRNGILVTAMACIGVSYTNAQQLDVRPTISLSQQTQEPSTTYTSLHKNGDNKHCIVRVVKEGKLKSMIKEGDNIVKLTVIGPINEKDIETAKDLPNIKCLDFSSVSNSSMSFELFDKNKLKKYCVLDTLYLPNCIKIDNAGVAYWNIMPKFVVSEGISYIYSNFADRRDFSDIQGFPNYNYVISGTNIIVPDTLYLTNAVRVNNFFSNCGNIRKVVFGKNLRYIADWAFRINGLEEVYFADGSRPIIDKGAFNQSTDFYGNHSTLKRIRVPKGYISYFEDMGFPKEILVDSDPNKGFNVAIEQPGTLKNYFEENQLKIVAGLKIKGVMDFSDIQTIRQMRNLALLDLSEAIVCMSENDLQREIQEHQHVSEMIGIASEAQYRKDRNRQNYKVRREIENFLDKGIESMNNEQLPNICEMPKGAFLGLPFLKVIVLPKTLSKIQLSSEKKFVDSKRLEVIWVSKEMANKLPLERLKRETDAEIKFY